MIDLTQSSVNNEGTLKERLNPNEPYILLCRSARLKTKNTDLADGEVDEDGKGGYLAINLRYTVMSGDLAGEDVWEHLNIVGFGKNAQYTTNWFLDGQRYLSTVLGHPVERIPTEEEEVVDSDLPAMAGQGVLAMLEIDTYQGKDKLVIARLLDHVEEVPGLDLGFDNSDSYTDELV